MRATLLVLIIAASVASATLFVPSTHVQPTEDLEAVDLSEFMKGFLEGAFGFVDMNSTQCAKALQKGFAVFEDIAKEIMAGETFDIASIK